MKIKDQVRLRREQLGLSIQEFAHLVDVSEQAVRYWEAGRSAPGRGTRAKVEDALRIQLDWQEGRDRYPAMLDIVLEEDLQLIEMLARLPLSAKAAFKALMQSHLDMAEAATKADEKGAVADVS